MRKRWTIMQGISRTRRAWTDYLREISQTEGIPDSYRQVIMYLDRNPGANQRNIAEFVGITTSAVNQVVKAMQKEEYLRKEPDPSDKRGSKLFLTEKGEDVALRLRKRLDKADAAITAFVGVEREKEMTEFLHELMEFIRKELNQC